MTDLMTPAEHTGIFQAFAESIVAEPPTEANPDQELDERVQRGALHLDEHYPGWANKIDLNIFRLTSASECVVGQLYHGGYSNSSLHKLSGIPYDGREYDDQRLEEWAGGMGFWGRDDEVGDWNKLQADWVKAIKARQKT